MEPPEGEAKIADGTVFKKAEDCLVDPEVAKNEAKQYKPLTA